MVKAPSSIQCHVVPLTPFFSRVPQEKTLSTLIMTGLDPVIFAEKQEDGRVLHGQNEKARESPARA